MQEEVTQRKLHEKQMEIEHLKTSGLQDKAKGSIKNSFESYFKSVIMIFN